jgi:hypothetical protein
LAELTGETKNMNASARPKPDAGRAPAILEIKGKGCVIVFSFASVTSGVPRNWAATPKASGVNLLPDFTDETVKTVADQVAHCTAVRQLGHSIYSLGSELGT